MTLASDPMLIMLPPSAPKAEKRFDHEEHAQHIRVELTVKFLLAELLEGRKHDCMPLDTNAFGRIRGRAGDLRID